MEFQSHSGVQHFNLQCNSFEEIRVVRNVFFCQQLKTKKLSRSAIFEQIDKLARQLSLHLFHNNDVTMNLTLCVCSTFLKDCVTQCSNHFFFPPSECFWSVSVCLQLISINSFKTWWRRRFASSTGCVWGTKIGRWGRTELPRGSQPNLSSWRLSCSV